MKNKTLAILAMTAIMTVISQTALFGQGTQEAIEGEMTPDISWRIENGTLYFTGKGVVPTTMFGARSPWLQHASLFHSVVIEDGITGLGQNLFVRYKNLTSLTIAGSVKDLGISSFNSCKKLSLVEVKGATPPDINHAAFYKVKFKDAKLIVPAGAKEAYEADPLWRKFGTIEESDQPADEQPVPAKTLAEPCVIRLTRTSNFVGGGVNAKVFLNGVEQERLGNGKTIVMQTDCDQNMLFIKTGKIDVAVRRFEATAGGDINIEFSYFNGYMKVVEDKNE